MKRSASLKGSVEHKGEHFPVIVQGDVSGGFWVNCPVLEGCYSQGETIDEALRNIREAIMLCLEDASRTSRKRADRAVSLHLVTI